MLKALSIKQPWADLVLTGKKNIELRSWDTDYRGYFFVHTSKTTDREMLLSIQQSKPNYQPILGAIIGIVRLAGIIPYEYLEQFLIHKDRHWCDENYYNTEEQLFGYLLEDPHQLRTPLYCNGSLKFFTVKLDDLWLYLIRELT